ncbi:MAG TPA: hypothetical protein VK826_05965 [Bacteroidia bacterium]|nr:hypothetical protein [Bacteroidia bacterium]
MKNANSKKGLSQDAAFDPNIITNIAVDTSYVYSQNTGIMYTGMGIYMMDNNFNGGSSSEGTLELNTTVNSPMQTMGYNVFPIDNGVTGATVAITGVQFSDGTNIWTDNGTPQESNGTSTCQWLGRAMQQGSMTYQLKIVIGFAGLPSKFYYWDPFATCNA